MFPSRAIAVAAVAAALLTPCAAGAITFPGAELIKRFEGFRPAVYRDGGGVRTVCWGLTGPAARPGASYSWLECQALFMRVYKQRYLAPVRDMVPDDTPPEQVRALVSFAWNLGPAALRRSALLEHHRAGRCEAAADEFLRWVHADGEVVPGLRRRRRIERRIYLRGCD
jgi:lysozyme